MVNRVDGSKTGALSGEVQIIARRVDLASFGIARIQSRFFSGLRPQVGYRQLSAEYVVPLHAHICCSAFRQRSACGGKRLDQAIKGDMVVNFNRSDERRVGKECVSTCRSRWWPDQ